MTADASGIDLRTGQPVHVSFDRTIASVDAGEPNETRLLAPGWIDLQVNGFAGVDFNDPAVSLDKVDQAIQGLLATGVTRAFPTVITGSPGGMTAALSALAKAREGLPLGEVIEGFHVEGPHISPEDGPRGAHPCAWVRPPDLEEFKRWQDAARGHVRLVTVAPEWPQALPYIESLVAQGVVVAIGHTAATPERIAAAVEAGASLSTHLGNAAHALMPRGSNYLWSQLSDDRLSASLIVDGIHLADDFVRVAVRSKGRERTILVTDASAPAVARPGTYRLGSQSITLDRRDRVVLSGTDRLAGSALRMDRAVANAVRIARVPLEEAVAFATTNPARVAGIAGRQAGVVVGDRADLVRFRLDEATGTIEVTDTWVGGVHAFAAA